MLSFLNKRNKKVDEKLNEISDKLEKSKIDEYVSLMDNTKKLIWKNFIAGVSRGVGIAMGVSIFGAILLIFLRKIVTLNIPIIGQFVSDIIDIVEMRNI